LTRLSGRNIKKDFGSRIFDFGFIKKLKKEFGIIH
jgi:hypothetical protein